MTRIDEQDDIGYNRANLETYEEEVKYDSASNGSFLKGDMENYDHDKVPSELFGTEVDPKLLDNGSQGLGAEV